MILGFILVGILFLLVLLMLTEKYWIKSTGNQKIYEYEYKYYVKVEIKYFNRWKRWVYSGIHADNAPRSHAIVNPFKTEKEARNYILEEYGEDNRNKILNSLNI